MVMLKSLCFAVMVYKQKPANTFFFLNNREKVEYQNNETISIC